jgi:hypothetical protein
MGGYYIAFLYVALMMVVVTPIMHWTLMQVDHNFRQEERINQNQEDEESEALMSPNDIDCPKRDLTWNDLTLSRYTVFALSTWFVVNWEMAFNAGSLNETLVKLHGMDPSVSSLCFLCTRISFAIATMIPVVLGSCCTRLQLTYVAFLFWSLGLYYRPGVMLDSEPLLWLTCLSLVLGGIGGGIAFVVNLPELMDSLEQVPGLVNQFDKEKLRAVISKYLMIVGATGQFAG